MRREIFGQDVIVHVVQRGARQANIVRDDSDRWRFLRLMRYLNDESVPRNWERDVTNEHICAGFKRPESWVKQQPYVSILAYCLMDNHFHILMRESLQDGIPRFMQRLCTSMATHFNIKYSESGSLFQGPYKARVVSDDIHLQYLAAYIQVKNPFEKFPRGMREAARNFDEAFDWTRNDPFNSLADFIGKRKSPLIDMATVQEVFEPDHIRSFAQDLIEGKYASDEYRELELD